VAATQTVFGCAGPLDGEHEEVVCVVTGCVDECVQELFLVCLPVDVDVLGSTGTLGKSQLEGEAALQQPLLWCHCEQTGEEPVEGNALAVACEGCTITLRPGLQSILEALAKRRRVFVSHDGAFWRARSMNACTRGGREAAADRRRRGVVSPRSMA
jgi:hypothetical protein